MPSLSSEEVEYSEDGKTKDSTQEYIEIDVLEGKERMMKIMKEQNIVDDFPIKCSTEGVALRILSKLLGE
jgi:hypothetical protein